MKQTLLAAGLMSGTSADGIDAALVRVTYSPRRVELVHYRETAHVPGLRDQILASARGEPGADLMCRLNGELGAAFGQAVIGLCQAAGMAVSELDVVGSHGQTVWHAPEAGVSLQLGSAAHIAAVCNRPVVSDFRGADLAAGGQGAPLTPVLHQALFTDPVKNRAVVNVGGIANVTWLPAGDNGSRLKACDSGPGNMVLDALAARYSDGRQTMDEGGAMAALGRVDEPLLAELLAAPYFSLPGPKSTGREQFGAGYADRMAANGSARGLTHEDVMATATALTARPIMQTLAVMGPVDEVLLCGGGANNPTLVAALAHALGQDVEVTTTDRAGVPASALEAMAFAELACRHLWNEPGNLPRVTGATGRRVLGCLTPAPNPN